MKAPTVIAAPASFHAEQRDDSGAVNDEWAGIDFRVEIDLRFQPDIVVKIESSTHAAALRCRIKAACIAATFKPDIFRRIADSCAGVNQPEREISHNQWVFLPVSELIFINAAFFFWHLTCCFDGRRVEMKLGHRMYLCEAVNGSSDLVLRN